MIKRMFFKIVLLLTIGSALIACKPETKLKNDSYVVILSLDAFRWDYPNIANTPTLNGMAEQGVKAKALIPCYPSKTFPNHYSIATGLYPDNHGIVCNRFFDKELGYYSIGDRDAVENPAFYGGEPIWLTAERQGLKAAMFFWVGSEAPIGGSYSSHWKPYDQKISFESRIDTVIGWLSLP
ncbi:MAG: ectonucleotide pyrophosphatase/phosphodiesterase, partial [Bacteroidales bacterium]|nr:ectonucleotide pyrophosphatase/phosphodiesterase [Bacteroidales bacterium]